MSASCETGTSAKITATPRHGDPGDPGFTLTENADLKSRNTFHVDARARRLIEVTHAAAVPRLMTEASTHDIVGEAPLILGEGSNTLFVGDVAGTVLSLTLRGIDILDDDGSRASVRVAAGENWNAFVHWSLAQGLCGLENLALIPGSVGAAPIQNIGAYGVEIGEFVAHVECWDRLNATSIRLAASECEFSYRDSIFKRNPDRYIVTAVEFDLPRQRELHIDYAGIGDELIALGVTKPTPILVAEAVKRLRLRKLPSPAVVGNAGSFFKNPVVATSVAEALKQKRFAIPSWPVDSQSTKLSAAWLIEACGLKGYRDGDAGISDRHALVLVNHGNASGPQLLAVARKVADAVEQNFGISIEPEPRIVGATFR
ncbi:MAG: UDP-N-acetylmuramate dehydrogenase [Dokdonella sp.]